MVVRFSVISTDLEVLEIIDKLDTDVKGVVLSELLIIKYGSDLVDIIKLRGKKVYLTWDNIRQNILEYFQDIGISGIYSMNPLFDDYLKFQESGLELLKHEHINTTY